MYTVKVLNLVSVLRCCFVMVGSGGINVLAAQSLIQIPEVITMDVKNGLERRFFITRKRLNPFQFESFV